MNVDLAIYIPWLPALAAVLCGLCATSSRLRVAAAPICIASIAAAFAISVGVSDQVTGATGGLFVHAFDWIQIPSADGKRLLFDSSFGYFLDPLTIVMLFVVTGVGTLVAIYASGYMAGDRGYARFFAYVSLFIFAMTTLVMADNLVLLYLGWEGVGLCSYLLIGYYYQKPSAVAAAKKAFIVNRIGDVGFALGIFLTYLTFDTVSFVGIFEKAAIYASHSVEVPLSVKAIPFLLMLGAFGKSAQIPLYVWLPDAMEGPTPVSALIHAATMVTAGVYMIARLLPVFVLSPYALPTVAVIGGVTALFAATIALCQYDIKRIYAYSTISQLGYMFLGVGVLSTFGAVFHLYTHAFFKALLFLTAGSVMHALAGQLDLRKMSGLAGKMPVTCWLMFAGCLALAGFPFTAGFYSKDTILAAAMQRGLSGDGGSQLFLLLAVVGLVTALLTAFYTFRLWFRVFLGPQQYEMGDEHHGADAHEPHEETKTHVEAEAQAGAEQTHAPAHGEHHDAHEVGWLMNAPLVILGIGALAAGWLEHENHWVARMIGASTAAVAAPHGAEAGGHHGPSLFGGDLHTEMMWISGIIAIVGIALAAYFHWINRAASDRAAASMRGLVTLLTNKYYIDEINDAVIVRPLRALGGVFYNVDRMIIDGVVFAVAWVPRALGLSIQPTQRGILQGYGLGMAAGVAVIAMLVIMAL